MKPIDNMQYHCLQFYMEWLMLNKEKKTISCIHVRINEPKKSWYVFVCKGIKYNIQLLANPENKNIYINT